MRLKDPGQLLVLFEELLRSAFFETIKVSEEWWPDDAKDNSTRLLLKSPELRSAVLETVTVAPCRTFLAMTLPLNHDVGNEACLEVYDEQGSLLFRRALLELNDLLLSAIHLELFRGMISSKPLNARLR